MKMKRLIAPILAAALFFQGIALARPEELPSVEYNYFEKMLKYAAELYIDDTVTADQLMQKAFSKLLEERPELVEEALKYGFGSLDEYSEFYSAEEYEKFLNSINHTFYGIGVVIRKEGEYTKIIRCLEDGAGAKAGVLEGDVIVGVDGQSAVGKTIDEVQEMIVGELDTEVTIDFLRDEQPITLTIRRQEVASDTVGLTFLEGDVAYVPIINFAVNTDKEFSEKLQEIDAKGITNIILDLRDNPGGYLESAVNIAKMIVPEGVIVQTMYRQEENNETFYSQIKDPKYKFVVLVNQNTASAAEVLSGAMQDSGVATLVGETTYGKAVIQSMFRLGDGRAFKLTTGHYLTRDGHEINRVGIDPDEYVINTTQNINTAQYHELDYKTKWQIGQSGESVRGAKERLKALGFYSGEINDQFDSELEQAVTEFQAAVYLYPYGVLDISTQLRLEDIFSELEMEADRQMKKAYEIFGGDPADIGLDWF